MGVEQWRAAVGAMAKSAAPKPCSPVGHRWKKWLKASDPVAYKGCVVLLVTIAQLVSSGMDLALSDVENAMYGVERAMRRQRKNLWKELCVPVG